jgi:FAD/FMN-containing dehydrogenase
MASTLDIAGLGGGIVRLTAEHLAALRARVEGPLLRPAEEGWDDAVRVWNGMVSKKPSVVVQPTSARDVAAIVVAARDHGLLLSVKGGGHNIAGTSIAEGGLMIDMSRLREVAVDAAARLARVGAGCRIADVDRATQAHGLATPLGFVSRTGVAGLTLGGGFGYLTRRFGWTADNLEEVEIVTADGEIRTADRERNADLFWAVRGGGGNFGIVTRFTFRLHEVGPTITGGLRAWSAERVDEVLAAYHELTDAAPRELTAVAVVRLAPPAPFVPREAQLKPIVALLLCHSGPNPEADLDALRRLPPPVVDLVGARPYTAQQAMLDDLEPDGFHQYWKTEFLPGLSSEYLGVWRDAALRVASPMSMSVIFHLAGALNERDDRDGAVGNRDARFISGFSGMWPPDVDGSAIVVAVRDGWTRIRPFSTGGNYVNFQLAEDGPERTKEAYRENLLRLQSIKAEVDPDNLFRLNRNISPAR